MGITTSFGAGNEWSKDTNSEQALLQKSAYFHSEASSADPPTIHGAATTYLGLCRALCQRNDASKGAGIDRRHWDFDGFFGSDGVLHATYLATVVERITEDVMLDGELVTLTNIPQDGLTDLRLLDHSLIVDLAVTDSDLTLSPPWPEVDEEVTASLAVHNAGDFAVGSFDVQLWVGDPMTTGVFVAQLTVPGLFLAGDTVNLEFVFNRPAAAGNLFAIVDSTAAVTEDIEANNTAIYYLENEPPKARVLASVTSGVAPLTVDLDASLSSDPEGGPLEYGWSFDDGSLSESGETVSHTFTEIGQFQVHLGVTDDKGAFSTATVVITVDPGPIIFIDGFESGDTTAWSSSVP